MNVVGLWAVGLGGGYVIGLTDVLPLSALGLATPLGVPGFWIGAIAGMAVAASGVVIYFFLVSEPGNVRAVGEGAAAPWRRTPYRAGAAALEHRIRDSAPYGAGNWPPAFVGVTATRHSPQVLAE